MPASFWNQNFLFTYCHIDWRLYEVYYNSYCCTGLAKPGPVIETFCSDELVSRYVKLDGVVTLVDSKHAMQHLNEVKPRFVVNEAVEQIAYADRIIVNKVKFVSWVLEKLTSPKRRGKKKIILLHRLNYSSFLENLNWHHSIHWCFPSILTDRSCDRSWTRDFDEKNKGNSFQLSLFCDGDREGEEKWK